MWETLLNAVAAELELLLRDLPAQWRDYWTGRVGKPPTPDSIRSLARGMPDPDVGQGAFWQGVQEACVSVLFFTYRHRSERRSVMRKSLEKLVRLGVRDNQGAPALAFTEESMKHSPMQVAMMLQTLLDALAVLSTHR